MNVENRRKIDADFRLFLYGIAISALNFSLIGLSAASPGRVPAVYGAARLGAAAALAGRAPHREPLHRHALQPRAGARRAPGHNGPAAHGQPRACLRQATIAAALLPRARRRTAAVPPRNARRQLRLGGTR